MPITGVGFKGVEDGDKVGELGVVDCSGVVEEAEAVGFIVGLVVGWGVNDGVGEGFTGWYEIGFGEGKTS